MPDVVSLASGVGIGSIIGAVLTYISAHAVRVDSSEERQRRAVSEFVKAVRLALTNRKEVDHANKAKRDQYIFMLKGVDAGKVPNSANATPQYFSELQEGFRRYEMRYRLYIADLQIALEELEIDISRPELREFLPVLRKTIGGMASAVAHADATLGTFDWLYPAGEVDSEQRRTEDVEQELPGDFGEDLTRDLRQLTERANHYLSPRGPVVRFADYLGWFRPGTTGNEFSPRG
ncbi:hypothetical protein ACT3SZ_13045 [Corynebacterium sp. AOP40-9SA-29]|uniref:hypothetical protein n=1 Tax=Corynebacterium sp. AOP40-9SA-29 TaxID=3457677 RepID=UPI0040343166